MEFLLKRRRSCYSVVAARNDAWSCDAALTSRGRLSVTCAVDQCNCQHCHRGHDDR